MSKRKKEEDVVEKEKESVEQEKESTAVRRKLNLQGDASRCENSGENEVVQVSFKFEKFFDTFS